MQQPPDTYITLEAACATALLGNSKPYNVIGVCLDFLPAAKSRGTDYTVKFSLWDQSWTQTGGMTFRFFHKMTQQLPAIEHTGDICILKNVSTKDFQGATGLSTYNSSWVVLSGSSVIDSKCSNGSDIRFVKSARGVSPSVAELQYAKYAAQQIDPARFRTPAAATALQVATIMQEAGGSATPSRGKARTLEQLSLSKTNAGSFADGRPAFADLMGEVRRIYPGDYQKFELYLTDYTTNPLLYNYSNESISRDGDEFGHTNSRKTWPGPWGRMTIKIICWDAHADFARTHVKEGMFVLVKNCQVKNDSNESSLEALCRGDRDEAAKVNILILRPHEASKDEAFKGLLQRRRSYEKMAAQQGLVFKNEPGLNFKKRTLDNAVADTHAEEPEVPKQLSKSKKKKLKQKAKAMQQSNQLTQPADVAGNPTVRCNNIQVANKTIDSILDANTLKRTTPAGNDYFLPFQNCRYKAKVRVVDFYPPDIADFAVPYQSSHYYEALSDDGDMDDADMLDQLAQSNPDSVQWEWRFILIVEDATVKLLDNNIARNRMPLLVAHKDAEGLLQEDACDLRENSEVLNKLREKMFHLWGDLQERKEEANASANSSELKASSKPFECLIKEYGVMSEGDERTRNRTERTASQYQRVFQICGTTIL